MIRKLAAGGEVCHLATSLDTDETQSTRRRREGTARPASRDGVVSASRACLQWAVHLFANKVVIFYYQRRPGRTHITTDRTCIWRFLRLLVRCPGVCIGRSLVVRVAGAGVYSPNTCAIHHGIHFCHRKLYDCADWDHSLGPTVSTVDSTSRSVFHCFRLAKHT